MFSIDLFNRIQIEWLIFVYPKRTYFLELASWDAYHRIRLIFIYYRWGIKFFRKIHMEALNMLYKAKLFSLADRSIGIKYFIILRYSQFHYDTLALWIILICLHILRGKYLSLGYLLLILYKIVTCLSLIWQIRSDLLLSKSNWGFNTLLYPITNWTISINRTLILLVSYQIILLIWLNSKSLINDLLISQTICTVACWWQMP